MPYIFEGICRNPHIPPYLRGVRTYQELIERTENPIEALVDYDFRKMDNPFFVPRTPDAPPPITRKILRDGYLSFEAQNLLVAEFGPALCPLHHAGKTNLETQILSLRLLHTRSRERTQINHLHDAIAFQHNQAMITLEWALRGFKDGLYTLDDFPLRREEPLDLSNISSDLDEAKQVVNELVKNCGSNGYLVDMMRDRVERNLAETVAAISRPRTTRSLPPLFRAAQL